MVNTIVADTDEDAIAEAQTYMTRFMEAQVEHYGAHHVDIGGIRGYEAWLATFERWKALCDPANIPEWTNAQIIGSPATAARRVQAFADAGFNHIILHTATPGAPREVQRRWAERFAREVAPRLAGVPLRPTEPGPALRAQEAHVEVLRLRAGRDAELGAQADAQLLEHAQRLGRVALHGERLHQEPLAGLAVRLAAGELAAGAHGRGELPSRRCRALPDRTPRAPASARRRASAALVEEGGLVAGEQRAARHEQRDL